MLWCFSDFLIDTYGEDNKNNRIKLGVLTTNKTIFFGSEESKERNKEIYGVEY